MRCCGARSGARRPVAHGPFQPEPVLPDAQYEQALEVLRNARNALERTPSMTAHLDEEKVRDLLLVFLNAQFEGAATGEVFNGAGKTDILIRAGDRRLQLADGWPGEFKRRSCGSFSLVVLPVLSVRLGLASLSDPAAPRRTPVGRASCPHHRERGPLTVVPPAAS